MGEQRSFQYLLENGIAVVQVNPAEDDDWDADPEDWAGGQDRPFLTALFEKMGSGGLAEGAVLDTSRVVIRGWSMGAAMVSWLFEVVATGGLPTGVGIAGGVMLSGGSYMCYSDGADAVGGCAGCLPDPTSGGGCYGNASDTRCSSCGGGGAGVYCSQCCPAGFTEPFYAAHPEAYARHPPVFLAQTSTVDAHADLCAARNYHDALTKHGGNSTLVLMRPDDEACFCVGTPGDADAALSPFRAHCADKDWHTCQSFIDTGCCVAHTLGFASMVEPMVNFVVDVVGRPRV